MNSRTITILIALFVLIIIGMFAFSFITKDQIAQEQLEEEQPEENVAYASITRIEGKHFFEDGVHTVAGEIAMPTPCDLLEVDATVQESDPEHIVLEFSVINNAEFCAQQITPQRYKISAQASENATFSARLEGRDVELNLIPAAEGESPDDFELFIKG